MVELVKININEHVYVKLTEYGIQSFLDEWNKYAFSKKHLLTKDYLDRRTDENGYTCLQIHEFIEFLGEKLTNGRDQVIVSNLIYFDKTELK